MAPAFTTLAFWRQYTMPVLKLVLALVCAYRFLYPFSNNPAKIIASDMGRHLYNGLHLFDPGFWGSIDAKFYQVWLHMVFVMGGAANHAIIALFTGAVSPAMPVLWYKAARELFSREKAMGFALFVAICPSFFFIYAVFMPETMMMPMLALCMWFSLRALRKHTLRAFIPAALCWVLVAHIKLSTAGMALVALPLLLYKQPRRLPALAVTVAFLAVTCIPAALHSYTHLKVYEPFHFSMPNKIYRKSGYTGFTFGAEGWGQWIFTSPSFTQNAFAPFGRYESWRKPGHYSFMINPANGIADWQRELRKLDANYTWDIRLKDWAENALFLALSPSWPDAWEDAPFTWQLISFHARWMWPPVMLLVLCCALFSLKGASEAKKLVLVMTWLMLMGLLFQQSGVSEGRYRKPVEPLMLLCILIMAEDAKQRGRNGLREAGVHSTERPGVAREVVQQDINRFTLDDFFKG